MNKGNAMAGCTYGVWANEQFDPEDYSNMADYYEEYGEAFDAWHALADSLPNGESAYLIRFDADGEPDENHAHELRREDGQTLEYYNGERMWC